MAAEREAYMIIDIGTGNVRVALSSTDGRILHVERDNICYEKDEHYVDALHFDPDTLWNQIISLTDKALKAVSGVEVKAITASSQREGIVLLDSKGEALIGLPNHDHRGREYEGSVTDKDFVYQRTGRYPSSLFSAMKLIGLKAKHPALYQRVGTMMSISDWAQYQLSGVAGYEHSQASETLLYDVAQKRWCEELCDLFQIDKAVLPEVHMSGTVLGNLLPKYAQMLQVSPQTPVIVGGADTQLAIKSTQPSLEDVVIVSGTTTPVVKITPEYIIDDQQRTWTNQHVVGERFILETNAGVTGLNYQRLKTIFYPNESYETIEKELMENTFSPPVASLGSLIADEKTPLSRGGFIFDVPVSHQLSRSCFAKAVLWDIACCIKENYEQLCDVVAHQPDYVWGCGGGLQSQTLRQCVANLLQKKVRIRSGFRQASVTGGALVCNDALGRKEQPDMDTQVIHPQDSSDTERRYAEWKSNRNGFKQIF